jgi:3-carboxy-cis,cis-muconate cycloisomerase
LTTFERLFVPAALEAAVSDTAWLDAMLRVERALARASGVELDEAAFDPALYDVERLAEEGRAEGNPVPPLVRALRERAGPDVHRGATSQDVLDSAAMLVARNALVLVGQELAGAAAECARLAAAHRSTPAAARTLLQQAVPTTFGYRASLWLSGLLDARDRLVALRLPAQLGGAAGTLAAFGADGLAVAARFAAELGLEAPLAPWHTNRAPAADLGAALDATASACGKIGLDVVLLAQPEVGEVAEGAGGGSSTMPHKRNPARAVLARSCARLVHANASVLASGEYEQERAAGAWQAEWPALSAALAFAGGAASAVRDCLAGLEIDAERMRENMGDELYSEARAFGIEGEYLGAAEELVDRILARYEGRLK